ncbi:MAG TPA: hypothetical protein VM537_32525 [Anaerolineae bacterium]|nr:hypothetical protein [Anaerolineae bacterium]
MPAGDPQAGETWRWRQGGLPIIHIERLRPIGKSLSFWVSDQDGDPYYVYESEILAYYEYVHGPEEASEHGDE